TRLLLHDLIHENADYIAVRVANILPFAINVVGPENYVIQAKHPLRGRQVKLDGILGDPVWIFRMRCKRFSHGHLTGSIYSNTGAKHKAFTSGPNGGVDQNHAADDVVRVIKAAYEVTKAFGRVRGEVIDVLDAMRGKDFVNQPNLGNRAMNELRPRVHIFLKASGEVVDDNHFLILREQHIDDVAPNEPGSAGD